MSGARPKTRPERDERPARRSPGESQRAVRRGRTFAVCVILAAFALTALALAALPAFYISVIDIEGADATPKEDIIRALNLGAGRSVFTVIPGLAENDIERNAGPYIKSAEVALSPPNTLIVRVVERVARAYVKVGDGDPLLVVDEDGMTLGTAGFAKDGLPIIVGLAVERFAVGEFTESPSGKAAFRSAILIDGILRENGLTGENGSLEINMRDLSDVHLYLGGVDVEFGSLDGANEKVLTAAECIKKLPDGARGFLDVGSSDEQATFRFLK
ncbi:MAG: FtsQ-type POTRA domain-containing protein [Clostridiales bacterium]|jgi:hypothetical protein|nr:FtsQ-type POTRA domain-containing protein [Clostridiales bacterium]